MTPIARQKVIQPRSRYYASVVRNSPVIPLAPSLPSPPLISYHPKASISVPLPRVHYQQMAPNSAAVKDSFIRQPIYHVPEFGLTRLFISLPVYHDPESGLAGFAMDNHIPFTTLTVATTDIATSTETLDTPIQQAPPPSTTNTTVCGARLLSEAFNVARTNAGQESLRQYSISVDLLPRRRRSLTGFF